MNIAVIPARGGSKRIPRKNVKPFAGRPVIAWATEAALTSGLFERVLVSTDDDEIAAAAEAAGAVAPFRRPVELSDDHCGTLEVIGHAVRWTIEAGWEVENVCCIYPTAPLLDAADLGAGLDRLSGGGWDYVMSAARFSCPVFRGFLRTDEGAMEMLFPEHRLTRSQDLPAVYHDAGQFYWGGADAWVDERPIFGPRTTFVELPPWRVQDIDTPEDWAMAERLFAMTEKEKS